MSASSMTREKPLPTSASVLSNAQEWVPQKYMVQGAEWLLMHACAGLFFKPGMKKTSITLCAFSALVKAKKARRMLVIAPLKVCWEVWPEEIKKWRQFNHLRCVVLHGESKEEELDQEAEVYVVNHAGLAWLLEDAKRFSRLDIDTLTVDESSFFRNPATQRFKKLKPILGTFARRWILTGTPNPRSYLDLFAQMYIVDMGLSLGRYITHYRNEYFYPSGYMGYDWKLQKDADKLIQERIKPYVFYLEREDHVKMPELKEHVVRVVLPETARKVYEELEEQMITELEGGEIVTAVSAGVVTMKCCQVANGGLYHEREWDRAEMTGKRKWTNLHNVKTEAVSDIISRTKTPVLVAYEYDHDLDRLLRQLGPRTAVMGSAGTAKERADLKKLLADWNAGKISVLLTQKQRASHGLNMQYGGCRTIIWHSQTWNLEEYIQLNERICRDGNSSACVDVYLITAHATVDEAKLRSLKSKDKSQAGFLNSLRAYVKSKKTQRQK